MTFSKHTTFTITADGVIERGCSDLPSAVRLPAVSVTPGALQDLQQRRSRSSAPQTFALEAILKTKVAGFGLSRGRPAESTGFQLAHRCHPAVVRNATKKGFWNCEHPGRPRDLQESEITHSRLQNWDNFSSITEKSEFLEDAHMKTKVGRPAFKATAKDRNVVRMLSGFGIPQDKIVTALGISLGTLHRYFKPEISAGAAQVEAELAGNLLRLSKGSDGTALKATMFALRARFGWSEFAPPPSPKKPELGKKETLNEEAKIGHENTGWGDLLQ